jgi:hypothetical protein
MSTCSMPPPSGLCLAARWRISCSSYCRCARSSGAGTGARPGALLRCCTGGTCGRGGRERLVSAVAGRTCLRGCGSRGGGPQQGRLPELITWGGGGIGGGMGGGAGGGIWGIWGSRLGAMCGSAPISGGSSWPKTSARPLVLSSCRSPADSAGGLPGGRLSTYASTLPSSVMPCSGWSRAARSSVPISCRGQQGCAGQLGGLCRRSGMQPAWPAARPCRPGRLQWPPRRTWHLKLPMPGCGPRRMRRSAALKMCASSWGSASCVLS